MKIRELKVEAVGQQKETKPVLYFFDEQKGLVLNKTNSMTIARLYGNDFSMWSGKPIECFSIPVEFSGEMRDAIRVREAATVESETTPEY